MLDLLRRGWSHARIAELVANEWKEAILGTGLPVGLPANDPINCPFLYHHILRDESYGFVQAVQGGRVVLLMHDTVKDLKQLNKQMGEARAQRKIGSEAAPWAKHFDGVFGSCGQSHKFSVAGFNQRFVQALDCDTPHRLDARRAEKLRIVRDREAQRLGRPATFGEFFFGVADDPVIVREVRVDYASVQESGLQTKSLHGAEDVLPAGRSNAHRCPRLALCPPFAAAFVKKLSLSDATRASQIGEALGFYRDAEHCEIAYRNGDLGALLDQASRLAVSLPRFLLALKREFGGPVLKSVSLEHRFLVMFSGASFSTALAWKLGLVSEPSAALLAASLIPASAVAVWALARLRASTVG